MISEADRTQLVVIDCRDQTSARKDEDEDDIELSLAGGCNVYCSSSFHLLADFARLRKAVPNRVPSATRCKSKRL